MILAIWASDNFATAAGSGCMCSWSRNEGALPSVTAQCRNACIVCAVAASFWLL